MRCVRLSKVIATKWKFIAVAFTFVLCYNYISCCTLNLMLMVMKHPASVKKEARIQADETHYENIDALATTTLVSTIQQPLSHFTIRTESSTPRVATETVIPGLDSMDKYLELPPIAEASPNSSEIDPYSQRRDYPLIISHNDTCISHKSSNLSDLPPGVTPENKIFLVITVKSRCSSLDRREAIRATWGNTSWILDNLGVEARLLFSVGECKNSEDEENILLEDSKYKDILQWEFYDSFRNLTLKQVLFLQWFASHCRHVPYLLQGDDDVLVNMKNVAQYLMNLTDEESRNLLIGSRLIGSRRVTDPRSKYYVSSRAYPKNTYPPYVSGGGYLLSGDLALRCFIESMKTRLIPIDDAFMGILFDSVGAKPENDESFKSWGMKDLSPLKLAGIKTLHRVLPNEMKKLWNAMKFYNITD